MTDYYNRKDERRKKFNKKKKDTFKHNNHQKYKLKDETKHNRR